MKRKQTMRHALLKHFLPMCLLPTILLSIVLCAVSYTLLINETMQKNASGLSQAMLNLASKIDTVNNSIVTLPALNGTSSQLSANSMYTLLLKSADTSAPIDLSMIAVYRQLHALVHTSYLRANGFINGIFFITRSNHVLSFANNFGLLDSSIHPMTYYLSNDSSSDRIMPHGMQGAYDGSFVITNKPAPSVLTLSFPINEVDTENPLAVCLIDMNGGLFESFGNLAANSDALISIVGADGSLWYQNHDAVVPVLPDSFYETRDAGAYFDVSTQSVICYDRLENWGGITLIYRASVRLTDTLRPMIPICLLFCAFSLTYSLIAMFYNARRFSKPIAQLAQVMATDALPDGVKSYSDIMELDALYAQYNAMMVSIRDYIKQTYADQLALTRMKMKAMESQMDSHFLYNTLECIYSMALMNGTTDVANVSMSLSNMFRYISKTTSATVTVRDEIRHVRDYITIQHARFGSRVACTISVDESIYEQRMLKLVLQPLVENSFKHGLREGSEPHRIWVLGERRSDDLLFTVRDNGVGISRQQLDRLRQQFETEVEPDTAGSGIGLANIVHRLRLYYGRKMLLNIDSVPGEGTTVTVIIPEGEVEPCIAMSSSKTN